MQGGEPKEDSAPSRARTATSQLLGGCGLWCRTGPVLLTFFSPFSLSGSGEAASKDSFSSTQHLGMTNELLGLGGAGGCPPGSAAAAGCCFHAQQLLLLRVALTFQSGSGFHMHAPGSTCTLLAADASHRTGC